MRTWVAATLARYKVPAVVERRHALPRTALGKLDKALLVLLVEAATGAAEPQPATGTGVSG